MKYVLIDGGKVKDVTQKVADKAREVVHKK